MDAGKLLTAMETVEEDHALVLDKIRSLRVATKGLHEVGPAEARPVLQRLRELNGFFATRFAAHCKEEDRTLFPLLEECLPDGRALVSNLRCDHESINQKRNEFGNCLQLASELEEGLTRAVVEDLFTYGWELWELLDNHAHAETEALRQCVLRLVKSPQEPGAVT